MPQFIRGTEPRGPAFPITKGREGYWPRRNSKALRQSSITMILGTVPGERVGEPEFGSRLHELVFEPADETTVRLAKKYTAEAIARWDPNVEVVAVAPEIVENEIRIFIDYFDRADLEQELRRTVFTIRGS